MSSQALMSDAECSCWEPGRGACVFGKALLARAGSCALAGRRSLGEHVPIECASATAHAACSDFAARLRDGARFALRLPPPSRPLMHMQALRLQCGGIAALRAHLDAAEADVQALVHRARPWDELPWPELVHALTAWQPRRRGRSGA